ncbi:MAG: hypothetical protein SF187_26465 [Deltaproteobacteria bacterium]|nr:hypothetical protein [Deltaproteobacteria bacterium]
MPTQRRNTIALVVVTVLGWTLSAHAAPLDIPAALVCHNSGQANCFDQGVFILKGSSDLLTMPCRARPLSAKDRTHTDCNFDVHLVAQRFVQTLEDAGLQPGALAWDQVAFFFVDSEDPEAASGSPGMTFFRAPVRGKEFGKPLGAALSAGANEVEGIGQAVTGLNPALPFVGYVDAGSTSVFGNVRASLGFDEADPKLRYERCGHVSACLRGMNGFQALAQATSHMFGPFLSPEPGLDDDAWYAMPQDQRSRCVPSTGSGIDYPVPASLLREGAACSDDVEPAPPLSNADVKAFPNLTQIAGLNLGSSFPKPLSRVLTVCPDNKEALAHRMQPEALVFAADTHRQRCLGGVPQRRGAGALHGLTRFRQWNAFIDMDTSLMGNGANWVENGNGTATTTGPAANMQASAPHFGQALQVFHPLELWLMGLVPDIGDISVYDATPSHLIGRAGNDGRFFVSAGPRMSASNVVSVASNATRLTVSPEALFGHAPARRPSYEQASHLLRQLWVVVTKPAELGAAHDGDRLQKINSLHVRHMQRWRKEWQQYWHMLTSYRGKTVSAFGEEADETPEWEFMQPLDDRKSFVPSQGIRFAVSGPQRDSYSPRVLSFMNVSTEGQSGELTLQPHRNQPPLRLDGRSDTPWPINSLEFRVSVPAQGPSHSFATVYLDDVAVRVPNDPSLFLRADGAFHTYVVDLGGVPGLWDKAHTSLKVVPSSEPIQGCPDETNFNDPTCLRIDFLRFTNRPAADLQDEDTDCLGRVRPDGLLALVDNCPGSYNPDQRDEDHNGVGDACQDDDHDGTIGLCESPVEDKTVATASGCSVATHAKPSGWCLVVLCILIVALWRLRVRANGAHDLLTQSKV